MSIKEGTTSLSFRIGEKFSSDFDVLQNIEIQNRLSDIGFSEFNQMSIKMRAGTTQIGNTLAGTGGIFAQTFFIDFYKKVHHIKGYNNKVWSLITNTWTDIGYNFVGNNFTFTPMLLPMMLNGLIPTTYTTAADSTGAERVKKAVADTGGAANIGKYLIITSNTANSEAYRGAYAPILDYDIATAEYTLNGAGLTTIVKTGATYQIYDTLGEYLQISNGVEFERYIYGKSNGTLVDNTSFTGLSTLGLRNVRGIQNTEFILKQISYDNSYWTFNKNTLYYTAGALNNPFFYNFTTVLSIPGSVTGYINDLFVFKDRLIIGGSSYAAHLKGPVTGLTSVQMITQSYGITPRTFVDVGIDGFYLSTNKRIFSLRENLSGTALIATDEGKLIGNYLKDYNFNLIGAFDGAKLYFYGEKVAGTPGIMTVLDIQYKFWSTYTGLSPSNITFNEGKIYLADNNSDIVRVFDDTVTKDIITNIEQKIAIKEISGGIPFRIKTLTDMYLWLDNFPQELSVSLYMANPLKNTKKSTKVIKLTQGDVTPSSNPMGQGVIGEGLMGGTAVSPDISLPLMKKLTYDTDDALLWKVILVGVNGSPFYLNQLDVEIILGDNDSYFDPSNTI